MRNLESNGAAPASIAASSARLGGLKLLGWGLDSNLRLRLAAAIIGIAILTAAALTLSPDGSMLLLALSLYILFLFLSYKWPWLLIALIVLASTNFLFLLDVRYLPVIHLFSGAQLNSLDLLIITVSLIALVKFLLRRQMPVFAGEVMWILVAAGISAGWGLFEHYINLDVALGGIRYFSAYLLYLSTGTLLSTSRDRRALAIIVAALVAFSLVLQGIEIATRSRLVLPTSTAGFYSQTGYVWVGGGNVPYLWNRAPAFLFLALFIFLSKYLIGRSKAALGFAALMFVGIAATLVRSWLIYMVVGCTFLFIFMYLRAPLFRTYIVRSTLALIIVGLLAAIALFALNQLGTWILRFQSLLNLGSDSSVLVRLRTAQIFYDLFLQSPLFGHGPGSIAGIEALYGVWSTDVGFVAALAGYGLIANVAVVVLAVRVVRKLNAIIGGPFAAGAYAYSFGLVAFVFVALVSYLFTQNYFFIQPWNYSLAIALSLADLTIRQTSSRVETVHAVQDSSA